MVHNTYASMAEALSVYLSVAGCQYLYMSRLNSEFIAFMPARLWHERSKLAVEPSHVLYWHPCKAQTIDG